MDKKEYSIFVHYGSFVIHEAFKGTNHELSGRVTELLARTYSDATRNGILHLYPPHTIQKVSVYDLAVTHKP